MGSSDDKEWDDQLWDLLIREVDKNSDGKVRDYF